MLCKMTLVQWRIYGGATGAIGPKMPPKGAKNVCDCRRRFEGGILSEIETNSQNIHSTARSLGLGLALTNNNN